MANNRTRYSCRSAQAINEKIESSLADQGIRASIQAGSVGKVQVILGNETSERVGNVQANTSHDKDELHVNAKESISQAGQSITERLLSAPIRISLSEVQVTIRLQPATPSDSIKTPSTPVLEDLSASILHVAEDYVREGGEAGLSRSVPGEADDDPFSAIPGAFASSSATSVSQHYEGREQVGLVAAIIQRLLARLQVEVREIRVVVILANTNGTAVQEYELRIAGISSQVSSEKDESSIKSTRTLEVQEPELWLRTSVNEEADPSDAPPQEAQHTPDSEDDLAMSMAIADLRDSEASLGTIRRPAGQRDSTSGRSSSSDGSDLFYSTVDSAARSALHPSRAADTETAEYESESLSANALNPDRIVPSARTTWSQVFGLFSHEHSEVKPAISLRLIEKCSADLATVSRQVSLAIPTLALSMRVEELGAAMSWSNQLNGWYSAANTSATQPVHSSSSDTLWHATVQSVKVFLPQPLSSPLLADLVKTPTTCDNFSLCIDLVQAAFRSQDASAKLAIRTYDFSFHKGQKSHTVFAPDPGIAWSYSATGLFPGSSVQLQDAWSETSNDISGWKTAIPAQASPQRPFCATQVLNDAVAVRLASTELSITLQPCHLRLDVAHLHGIIPLFESVSAIPPSTHRKQEPAEVAVTGDASRRVKVKTGCLRVSLRCPKPSSGRLRSGYFTFDIWDPALTAGQTVVNERNTKQARFAEISPSPSHSDLRFARLFAFSRADHHRTICYMSCGGTGSSRLPGVALLPSSVGLDLPLVTLKLDKPIIQQLQYLADDLGQSLSLFAASTRLAQSVSHTDELQRTVPSAPLEIRVNIDESRLP